MDFYTMNENFIAQGVVDEFISAIWTERYSAAGEVQLVTAATVEMATKLQEGTFLGLRGSDEVMQLHTQSIEGNTLTVVGSSLTQFLDERPFWARNPATDAPASRVGDLTVTMKVGQAIADVVEDMVINTSSFTLGWDPANLEWESEEIPFLTLGDIYTGGDDERITFTIGPLYKTISDVAAKFGVGIQLYLETASVDAGYTLKFRTYKGQNRTTVLSNKTGTAPDNVTDPPAAVDWGTQLVRLVPDMESLSSMKEIRSIALYKNVVYVYYDGEISVHYEDPLNIPTGFDRRVLVTNAEGEPVGRKVQYNPTWWRYGAPTTQKEYTLPPTPGDEDEFRAQHAKDVLANHNYIKAVDGQTSPNNDYKYGVDYGLGDVVELKSLSGLFSKARITEYIRSQDSTGEREYPTISVI